MFLRSYQWHPTREIPFHRKNRNAGAKMFFLFLFDFPLRVHNVKILNRNFLFNLSGNSFERQGKLSNFRTLCNRWQHRCEEKREIALGNFIVQWDELSIAVTDIA